MWTLLICIALIIFLLYKYLDKCWSYWKHRNIPYRVVWSDLYAFFFGKKSFYDMFIDQYRDPRFADNRYVGLFQMTTPVLLIKDLEIIKSITIKDFDHFTDHNMLSNPKIEELLSKNLVVLKGQVWRDMRNLLSPAFTGSKMRAMFPLMSECARKLTEFFVEQSGDMHEMEVKDLFTRYTNDVIATCAFGFECNSVKDKENEFYMTGKKALDFGGLRMLSFLVAQVSPTLYKLLRLRFFPVAITDFFTSIIKQTIKYRVDHQIVRPDMVHLLLEARKGNLKHEMEHDTEESFAVVDESDVGKKLSKTKYDLSDVDIAAQGFIFFIAGFETAATMLCFMATELALNPDVQQKLYAEIDEAYESCNGKFSYEVVMRMKYLDMVVSESLRKWPPAAGTDRVCTEDYTIKAATGEYGDVQLKRGDMVMIPILGIHRDARYYVDPDHFDPERFSDENKAKINMDAYKPFGFGPRACIGSRFALLEIKVLFAHILAKFELVPTAKTTVPLKLNMKGFKIEPLGGFWLGFKKRSTVH